jgi:hypothetical protein
VKGKEERKEKIEKEERKIGSSIRTTINKNGL